MGKGRLLFAALALVAVLMAAGCGTGRTPAPTTQPSPLSLTPTPTVSPEPTPTVCPEAPTAPQRDVTPGGPVQVAFTKEGDVWHWREAGEAVRLTRFGDVRRVTVSDDGAVIAFLRGLDVFQTPELWAVNSDGSNVRCLLRKDDLEALVHNDPYAISASLRGLT